MCRDQWRFQHALEWQALWLSIWMDLPDKKRYYCFLMHIIIIIFLVDIFFHNFEKKKTFKMCFSEWFPVEGEIWKWHKDLPVFNASEDTESLWHPAGNSHRSLWFQKEQCDSSKIGNVTLNINAYVSIHTYSNKWYFGFFFFMSWASS